MKIKEIILSIIMLLIGATATYFFESIKSKNDNQKRFIEYEIRENNDVFSKPNISNKKITILLDGKPVEQLSQITIPLYNLKNDNDLKDLKIYFEFYTPHGDSIKLVNSSATREDNTTDGISAINNLNPPYNKGGVKRGFSVSSLNRNENLNPSLYANFYFEGSTVPVCKVFVDQPDVKDQPGVEARLFTYKNFVNWYNSSWGISLILLVVLIAYFVFVVLVFRLLSYLNKEKKEKKKKEKEDYIIKQFQLKEMDLVFTNPENIVKEILFQGEYYDWEHVSAFTKLVSNLKEPQKKD